MEQANYRLPYFNDNIYHFNHGTHRQAYRFLGVHPVTYQDQSGYRFSVWAPNAYKVYLQGDFNDWQLMELDHCPGGVWTGFVAGAKKGQHYKYGIDHGNGHISYRMDPFGFKHEIAPKDASIIEELTPFEWNDDLWMKERAKTQWLEKPIQIYEVHFDSWRKHYDGTSYTFDDLARVLIPYVKEMGYTHIEFMPLTEHPLDASWGYQVTGYYAVAGAYGTIRELQSFINEAHRQGIGVFMDWVPGHFCANENALAYFDGTPTFEYADPNKGINRGWGARNFDLGRDPVKSFLISNALFWIKEMHVDGLRVDAVSNMLYLDFNEGPWTPNIHGGNINLEGVQFLQELNTAIKEEAPGVLTMAEESTDWEGITHPVEEGGLGFDYKWNMGWMNDTLKFFEEDSLYRSHHYRLITFVFMYQYNERYILPYSHDEVVHGKDSMLGKMPGSSRFDQFSDLRVQFGYMMAQPGKKLNFMGHELGQFLEWRYYEELEWDGLQREYNSEYQHFVKTVNHIAKTHPAFYELDHSPEGLDVLDADNIDEVMLSFIRKGKKATDFIIAIMNFVPVKRQKVRVGVPYLGQYCVILNSQMQEFGGSWTRNIPTMTAEAIPFNNQPYSIELTIPSHSVLYIQPVVNSLVISDDKQKPRKETKDTESFNKEHEK
ncbi:1,4-alpha-glucan branching protein GlgB [Dolosicoccus paucivorans]|uniref:1,4-alpha-glucan branching protein GlgB n=1 Tax=Dolosicoccus paucivorans TaxID=84521 RepID=UPI000884A198|nr:1,4-alpha-glucan branching protein GlgB [Dolosicoccus paucivorans]SDI75325.1 1,4-alpha-glucan branching enzyme [Dolosicoccus paucivorans]